MSKSMTQLQAEINKIIKNNQVKYGFPFRKAEYWNGEAWIEVSVLPSWVERKEWQEDMEKLERQKERDKQWEEYKRRFKEKRKGNK